MQLDFLKDNNKVNDILRSAVWTFVVGMISMIPTIIRLLFFIVYGMEFSADLFFNRGEFYIYSLSLATSGLLLIFDDDFSFTQKEDNKFNRKNYAILLFFLLGILLILSSLVAPSEAIEKLFAIKNQYIESNGNEMELNRSFLYVASVISLICSLIMLGIVKYKLNRFKSVKNLGEEYFDRDKMNANIEKQVDEIRNQEVTESTLVSGDNLNMETKNTLTEKAIDLEELSKELYSDVDN